MPLTRLASLAALLLVALLAATNLAWGDPSPPPEAERDAPSYPWAVRTGDAKVDRIIGILQQGDTDALLSLIRYTKVACVKKQVEHMTPQPPLCQGKPVGTLLDVFLWGSCTTEWLPPDLTAAYVAAWMANGYRLYAATRLKDVKPPTFDEFRVLFVATLPGEPRDYASTLYLNESGRVVSLAWRNCGDPPLEAWLDGAGPVILGPKVRR